MPFVSNMDDEEKKLGGPQTPGGGAVRLAPSTGVQSGGAPSGTAPTQGGGQFASLNQYLTANQGNAEPLAQKITAGANKELSTLGTQNQEALSKIGSQVSANTGAENYDKTIAEESANPVSFASDPGKVASFQNVLNASYKGPQSAENTSEFSNQQAAINKAIAEGESSVKSEAGRQNLIAKTAAKPTSSVTALNSAILSKSPEALASVENAYKPFQNLVAGLKGGAVEQNRAIADQQAKVAAGKDAAAKALTSQMTGLNTNVSGELTAAQQKMAAQNEKVKAEIAGGNVSDESLNALGMTRDQWNSLSTAQKDAATSQDVFSNQHQFGAKSGTTNVDLTNFLNQTDPNSVLNAGNVATKEDYAKAQAFKSLLGNLNLQTPDLLINPNAASEAGTAPTNVNGFDYQTALGVAQQAKSDQLASAQAYVDALQSGADEEHAQLAAVQAAKKSMATRAASIAQTPIAATNAAVQGTAEGGKTYLQKLASSNPKQIAANVLTMGMAPVAQGVAKGVEKAVKTVTDIFCFHPDTLVTMDNGSLLPICRIGVGDMTQGGKVLATTRAIGQDFYWYNGVIVTGKHAVKEDGKWVRIENSRLGHKFKYLTEVVCNLVTEKHRIYANGIEFADEHETDLYESLDMDASLQELNRNA